MRLGWTITGSHFGGALESGVGLLVRKEKDGLVDFLVVVRVRRGYFGGMITAVFFWGEINWPGQCAALVVGCSCTPWWYWTF